MKPKPILRSLIILFAAVTSIYFLESTRKTNNIHAKHLSSVCSDVENLKASNNDFIFFESISKYLLVSLCK